MKSLLKFIPFFGLAFIMKACIVEPIDAELILMIQLYFRAN